MNDKVEEQRDRRIFDRAHARAAGSTGRAQNNARYHQAELQKYKVSQASPNPNTRKNGQIIYCRYLAGLHADLSQAADDHENAIQRGNYYVRRWSRSPAFRQQVARIKSMTANLTRAHKGIEAHAQAIERERRAYRC